MNKRVNIMLPESTLAVLDRVASKGNRSRFISHAVLHYVGSRSKQCCENSSRRDTRLMPRRA